MLLHEKRDRIFGKRFDLRSGIDQYCCRDLSYKEDSLNDFRGYLEECGRVSLWGVIAPHSEQGWHLDAPENMHYLDNGICLGMLWVKLRGQAQPPCGWWLGTSCRKSVIGSLRGHGLPVDRTPSVQTFLSPVQFRSRVSSCRVLRDKLAHFPMHRRSMASLCILRARTKFQKHRDGSWSRRGSWNSEFPMQDLQNNMFCLGGRIRRLFQK